MIESHCKFIKDIHPEDLKFGEYRLLGKNIIITPVVIDGQRSYAQFKQLKDGRSYRCLTVTSSSDSVLEPRPGTGGNDLALVKLTTFCHSNFVKQCPGVVAYQVFPVQPTPKSRSSWHSIKGLKGVVQQPRFEDLVKTLLNGSKPGFRTFAVNQQQICSDGLKRKIGRMYGMRFRTLLPIFELLKNNCTMKKGYSSIDPMKVTYALANQRYGAKALKKLPLSETLQHLTLFSNPEQSHALESWLSKVLMKHQAHFKFHSKVDISIQLPSRKGKRSTIDIVRRYLVATEAKPLYGANVSCEVPLAEVSVLYRIISNIKGKILTAKHRVLSTEMLNIVSIQKASNGWTVRVNPDLLRMKQGRLLKALNK